ncbi:hypothetical protein MHBO_002802 [Bonamia ostreae]|uniref:Uncharacterized protein n=1 Tax=Bonamia ostreae TaxID=126728 RepID=A0ABV2API1_9EUKA
MVTEIKHLQPCVENLPEGLHLCECLVKMEKGVKLMFYNETGNGLSISKRTVVGAINSANFTMKLDVSPSVPEVKRQSQEGWNQPFNLEGLGFTTKHVL